MVYSYEPEEKLLTGHTGRLFVLLTAIWLCVSLSTRLIPPLLPEIIDQLAITAFLAGIAVTTERIARAGMQYPSGRVADGLSRTVVLLACGVVVIIGVLLLSVSTTYVFFLLGLFIFGVGRGMYAPASRALLSDIFRRKRGMALGIHMLGSEMSGILGAGLAVFIVSVATWRAAFLPLALLLIPLFVAFHLLSQEPIQGGSLDLALRQTGTRIIGDQSLRTILLVYSLYVLSAAGVTTFLPLFLIEVHNVSFALASGGFALLYATGMVAKPIGGVASDRLPRLSVGSGTLALGAVGLAILILAPTTGLALVGVIIYAFGHRGFPPPLQAYLMDHFADAHMAGDFGAMRTVYVLIGSFGPAYAGLAANTIGFTATFLSFLLFYILGAGILLWLSKIN